MSTPELLSDDGLAAIFGGDIDGRKVGDWRRRYDWPHITVGRTIRYTPEQVEQILRKHQVTAPAKKAAALPGQTKRSASRGT